MDRTAIWPLIDPVFYALSEAVDREIAPAFIAEGFQGIQWWIAHQAWVFIDDSFTVRTLQLRMPFAGSTLLDDAMFDLLADRLFVHVDEGVYRLSDKGIEVVDRLLEVIDRAIGYLTPLPADELETLAHLLRLSVVAVLDSDNLSDPSVTRTTYQRQWPGLDAPAPVRIRHALEILRAYHDEVERAVWHGVVKSAPEWDVLTTIADAQGMTPTVVRQVLAERRALPEKVYDAALKALSKRGWIAINGDGRTTILTEAGKRQRQDVATRIDAYFAQPLDDLSDSDAAQLHDLLHKLKQALTP